MKKSALFYSLSIRIVLIFIVGSMILGCSGKPKIVLTSDYQAVFLDNGQAFFGKLEKADTPFPLLKDVFYIQQLVNKETNEVKNTLVKRGNEWHGPDRMYINARHIVLIEPVTPGSKISQLIKDAKAKKTVTE
jgi:hypothetical protein